MKNSRVGRRTPNKQTNKQTNKLTNKQTNYLSEILLKNNSDLDFKMIDGIFPTINLVSFLNKDLNFGDNLEMIHI